MLLGLVAWLIWLGRRKLSLLTNVTDCHACFGTFSFTHLRRGAINLLEIKARFETRNQILVRPGRLELPHPAPEAGALSTELRAHTRRLYRPRGPAGNARAASVGGAGLPTAEML